MKMITATCKTPLKVQFFAALYLDRTDMQRLKALQSVSPAYEEAGITDDVRHERHT